MHELLSLHSWLRSESELHGRVTLDEAEITEGELGGVFDALSVAVASGGALSVLASSVIVWLRQRTGDVVIRMRSGDRTVEISAKRVQDFDAKNLEGTIVSVLETFNSEE